ncbi:MAG: UDP-N-acetylglucosamine 1-carboxyvinyltransferase, partial [Patescibacteria group bacterium]|nr:UDP-N-acetylglucosamine 1-carboxyvinyltransferase [Patescibacteria group bacterium]
MAKFIIQGGAKLSGEIAVGGAKNNAQIMIPASLLSREKMTITNLPLIDGVEKSFELLSYLGANIERKGNEAIIDTSDITKIELDPKIADKFRTSVMFVGPIL